MSSNKVVNSLPNYRCSQSIFDEKIEKLRQAIEIIKSNHKAPIISNDVVDFDQVYALYKLFPNSTEFSKRFTIVKNLGMDDPRISDCYSWIDTVYNVLKRYDELGFDEVAKAIKGFERDLPAFEEAREKVAGYVETERCYQTDILDELNIEQKVLDRYANKMKYKYPKLFLEYTTRVQENKLECYYNDIARFEDIAKAIEKGYFDDGTELNVLEFWRRTPLKKDSNDTMNLYNQINPSIKGWCKNFRSRVEIFTKATLSEEQHNLIMNYMYSNGIYNTNRLTEHDIRYRYGRMRIFLGVELTDEDFEYMIKYIKVSGLYFSYDIYLKVLDEYLNGRLTKEMIDNLESKLPYTRKKNRI